jgi:hypothetical protein
LSSSSPMMSPDRPPSSSSSWETTLSVGDKGDEGDVASWLLLELLLLLLLSLFAAKEFFKFTLDLLLPSM